MSALAYVQVSFGCSWPATQLQHMLEWHATNGSAHYNESESRPHRRTHILTRPLSGLTRPLSGLSRRTSS